MPECLAFKILRDIPLVSFPFILLSFFAVPSSVSASHSLYQTTLMLMSLKPQVLLVPLEVLTSVPANPSPGSNFPGMKLQGPQLSSLFSNNSSSECECVSDWIVMSVPETEPQYLPLSLEMDLFSRDLSPHPIVDPLGICGDLLHTHQICKWMQGG